MEVQGYSEKGARRRKTPTVIDGNCEDEDDDIFSSRTCPTNPRVTGTIRYGLSTPPWRRHCTAIAANGLIFAIAERLHRHHSSLFGRSVRVVDRPFSYSV